MLFLVSHIVSMNFSKSKIQMGKKRTFLDFFFLISMQYLLKDSILPDAVIIILVISWQIQSLQVLMQAIP